MHRTHVANVKFAATLSLSAFMFCGLASAQAPSNLFQHIPVSFEENRGQFADDSRFLIHATNARINMKATQLEIYRTPKLPDTKAKQLNNEPPLVMSFVNANSKAVAAPSEESPRKSHYIFNDGGQMPKVITAKHFRSVRVANLYPGIDAVYYDKAGEVEYDLIVQPNADPKQVRLHFGGAATAIDANGNINISAEGETVIHRSPVVYQGEAKSKSSVASRYVRNRDGTFGIELGKRDASKLLTIDPVISFATHLLANSNSTNLSLISDITSDAAGRPLVVGRADLSDFPLKNNLLPPPTDVTFLGFVTRFNRGGTDIEFSTFVATGSTNFVRLDDAGNIYVAAQANTKTGIVPAGLNAYKSTGTGAYIFKLSPNGDAMLGASYLGATDTVTGFAVSSSGAVAISGNLAGGAIAASPGAWLASGGAFVAKLQATLSATDFITYAPEAGTVALDANGSVYVGGGTASATYPVTAGAFQTVKKDNQDVFVTKLSSSGGLLLSTFIGSNKGGDCYSGDDWATSLVVGNDGGVYVAGHTMGIDPPGTSPFTSSRYLEWNGRSLTSSFPGGDDSRAFLLKLAPDFASLTFSGSIITTNFHHVPAGSSTQADCQRNYGGGLVKVSLDNNQNAYLFAGSVENLFPTGPDNLVTNGDNVLIVNASGARIAATKIPASHAYTISPTTGAMYFSTSNSIQSTTGVSAATGPLLMKLVSPLARVTLAADVNPLTVGQTLTLTASTTALPVGGTFVLQRDGVEFTRQQISGGNTTFTVPALPVGFYAFTVAYELPDLSGTLRSRTLAQTVTQTAVCP
jgi:hypothetical protein